MIWDYERIVNYETISSHEHEVQIIHFIKPFPLLLTSDSAGNIYIWCTKKDPMKKSLECMAAMRHQDMNKAVPVTAINSYYNEKTGEFLLLQGDENGEVVVYDISVILRKRPDIVPIDVTKGNVKRNPHREFKNFKEDAEE